MNQWWKKAVVYQVYPKSFQDTNGDGIGDISGIIKRLNYLEELGVNVIWLSPVYQSPMDDGGYDISDYYRIDPIFGSNEDMDRLIKEADQHGMKILMDLVVNHTSDEHQWFQKALADPKSPYRDYYIFREGDQGQPPNNWRSYFGGSAWEKVGDSNIYYLHAFGKKQPDLNWENKQLREEIYNMVNYWLDKGLGGFRIDAICNLKKNFQTGILPSDGQDGLCYIGKWILNQPGIETYLSELKERTFKPHNSMTVAEANVPDHLLRQFIGEDGFFSMVFDFSYTDLDVPETGEWYRPVQWDIKTLKERIFHSQIETQKRGWGAVYLENHDQPRSLNKYLKKEEINYYSTTMLGTLFLLLRGTPFIYQGQEIGMTNIPINEIEEYDDLATKDQYNRAILSGCSKTEALAAVNKRSRDNSRTPMQWNEEENAGFTKAEHPWIKVNPNYKEINVEIQKNKETSVLKFYKELIRLRKTSSYQNVLTDGEFEPYETEEDSVIAYQRRDETKEILVLINFQNKNAKAEIKREVKKVVLGNYKITEIDGNILNLKPFEALVLELERNEKIVEGKE